MILTCSSASLISSLLIPLSAFLSRFNRPGIISHELRGPFWNIFLMSPLDSDKPLFTLPSDFAISVAWILYFGIAAKHLMASL